MFGFAEARVRAEGKKKRGESGLKQSETNVDEWGGSNDFMVEKVARKDGPIFRLRCDIELNMLHNF